VAAGNTFAGIADAVFLAEFWVETDGVNSVVIVLKVAQRLELLGLLTVSLSGSLYFTRTLYRTMYLYNSGALSELLRRIFSRNLENVGCQSDLVTTLLLREAEISFSLGDNERAVASRFAARAWPAPLIAGALHVELQVRHRISEGNLFLHRRKIYESSHD